MTFQRSKPPARNHGVVYSGKVGAPMRPARRRPAALRKPQAVAITCEGGPFSGRQIKVNPEAPGNTLPFVVGQWCGWYGPGGKWVDATA